jgi:hypothetical protein
MRERKRSGLVDAGCSGEATGRFYRGGEGVERPVVELELMTTTIDVWVAMLPGGGN